MSTKIKTIIFLKLDVPCLNNFKLVMVVILCMYVLADKIILMKFNRNSRVK